MLRCFRKTKACFFQDNALIVVCEMQLEGEDSCSRCACSGAGWVENEALPFNNSSESVTKHGGTYSVAACVKNRQARRIVRRRVCKESKEKEWRQVERKKWKERKENEKKDKKIS